MLFVSGEKPERFPKALAAGADLVCIDLEDAVHPDFKHAARQQVLDFARAHRGAPLAVRLNQLRGPEGLRDLLALAESGAVLDWLLLPKVEHPDDLSLVHAVAGHAFHQLMPLIETPLGLQHAPVMAAMARTDAPKLAGLMLGGADLSVELGCAFSWDGLLHARGALVAAARRTGLQVWDVPHLDLTDLDGLRDETRRVAALGFTCKSAIHPTQVAPIHEAFLPPQADVAWAQAMLEAEAAHHTGAFIFQGKMVDPPVLAKARRVLRMAGAAS
ncbi:CoA ester lyase [Ramlibacter sp.]|uniref:HpcH/HpaI aldolase/citrate lyase family protein n=1 Tax=Ramlibacter sp. TaxID=1917967 RepID=UPI0035AD9D43